jgi:hypothetical protein
MRVVTMTERPSVQLAEICIVHIASGRHYGTFTVRVRDLMPDETQPATNPARRPPGGNDHGEDPDSINS